MSELVVGIDIGGTNTKIGIVNRGGELLQHTSIATTAYIEVEDYFEAMANAIRKLKKKLKEDVLVGIGVGAANGNYYTGTIDKSTNLKWKGTIHLAKMFNRAFDIPCLLTNDANAAALGEMIYGNAKGMKDFIVITLGTGLGSGFVCNGKLLNGHHGVAGELGHTSVRLIPVADT